MPIAFYVKNVRETFQIQSKNSAWGKFIGFNRAELSNSYLQMLLEFNGLFLFGISEKNECFLSGIKSLDLFPSKGNFINTCIHKEIVLSKCSRILF